MMANTRAAFKQVDVTRAAKGVTQAGLPVAKIEIDRDGKIVITVQGSHSDTAANDWD